MARTVLGDVPAEELGVTLQHENLIHRISLHSGKVDNTCVDVDVMTEEIIAFRDAGGGTICDLTPMNTGRDPQALRLLSERTGVSIVSGLGLYQLSVWSPGMRALSRGELADFLVREADGLSSGVAAGLIGEIASHNEPDHSDWRRYRLWDEEIRVFEAIADVQQRTGLSVSTHASLGRGGAAQLRTLIEAGGDPSRVVIGHCDAQSHDDIDLDLDYYRTLLKHGASLAFDMFGWAEMMTDAARCERIAALVQEGYADRIMVSTDTCRLSQLRRFGGRGFDYLFTTVISWLRSAGLSQRDVDLITILNPAAMLSLQPRH
jgi:phosphotriesterase-related protein